jgi:hypothetical protein
MGIPDLKARLVRKILETNDKEVLNEIYRLLGSGNKDFYKNLTDDQKAEIELGLRQIKNGETISLDDFLKRVS